MIRPRLSVANVELGGLRFGKFGYKVGRGDASAKNLWGDFPTQYWRSIGGLRGGRFYFSLTAVTTS